MDWNGLWEEVDGQKFVFSRRTQTNHYFCVPCPHMSYDIIVMDIAEEHDITDEEWNDLMGKMTESIEDENDFPTKYTTDLNFHVGNPSARIIRGVVHLFKSNSKQQSDIVCIIAVPSWMSLPEFYRWLGVHTQNMEQIKILNDRSPNRYMTVIQMKGCQEAQEFLEEVNTKRFSSMSNEICFAGYVNKIEFGERGTLFQDYKKNQLKEIPTCPVCLERLDTTESSVLTTTCQHAFHCQCLIRWKDDSCPVCRFALQPIGHQTKCAECGEEDELWICLICGHVGCSRYKQSHANTHAMETHHSYSMEVATNRVWDYIGDGYVHRLVQTKSDGKLVEVPKPGGGGGSNSPLGDSADCSANNATGLSKEESSDLEYQYLIAAQLDTQRTYFEDIIKKSDHKYQTKLQALHNENIRFAEQFKKAMSQILDLKRDNAKQEKTIQDLTEQVRDLLIHFESSQKIKEQESGLKDGDKVTVKSPSETPTKDTKPGRKRKK